MVGQVISIGRLIAFQIQMQSFSIISSNKVHASDLSKSLTKISRLRNGPFLFKGLFFVVISQLYSPATAVMDSKY